MYVDRHIWENSIDSDRSATLGRVLSVTSIFSFSDLPRPEGIKLFHARLSMRFFLLINVKMPTIFGILTCTSGKNSILRIWALKSQISWYFHTYEHLKFHAQLNLAWKKFITSLGPYQVDVLKTRKTTLALSIFFSYLPSQTICVWTKTADLFGI